MFLRVHGLIRGVERFVDFLASGEGIDAVGHADLQARALPGDHLGGNRTGQGGGLGRRRVFVGLWQDDTELVSAQPPDHVRAA